MITVFTPTYNRADLLPKLYYSLCNQTCFDFEWIIVDDGSTDNTEIVIKSFKADGIIPINYLIQENRGKHIAINHGIQYAKGELFFIVDSDDVITPDAIAVINEYYKTIREDKQFCGVCGLKAYFTGEKVGGESDFKLLDCNYFEFRYKYKINGDMAEVFLTDILKKYPFPEFEGEKYCAESTVYNRIANDGYIMRYFYKKIYLCEYLPDGLSRQSIKMRCNSPRTACLYYRELLSYNLPLKEKMKGAINYWRFWFWHKKKIGYLDLHWLWAYPLGLCMHIKDKLLIK